MSGEKPFCCQGCRIVYQVLTENGLGQFYDLNAQAGARVGQPAGPDRFQFLDDPAVQGRMVDFADERISKVTLQIPAIHCIACVWLLENLFRLQPGIGRTTVNFPRREATITFEHGRLKFSELVAFLASLGYEPVFNLANLEQRPADPAARRLWLRLGVAGFAFGNIMLVSIPSYFGLTSSSEPALKAFFGWLSVALTLPVFVYSAADYWRAAWLAVRRRLITIDLPIALGLVAIFGQSLFEIIGGRGEGYLDSLTGLIFFLLCGKVFQHKTYDRLTFDRDYRSFFPLSVVRQTAEGEETVSLSKVAVGDRLRLRHGELVPADARLLNGRGVIDYSFVTGESEPVEKKPGDYLYAGGQQCGGAVEVETVKPVSQSYLTSLWSHETFRKERRDALDTLTNRFSRRFTVTIALVAIGAAAWWWGVRGDAARAVKAFASVMIVACPCALALAAPFALGTAQRLLTRRNIFLKNPNVVEALARVDTVVFDKTGTLTSPGGDVEFTGAPLAPAESEAVRTLARHSTHPLAARLAARLEVGPAGSVGLSDPKVNGFREIAGAGVDGRVAERHVALGSPAWLTSLGIAVPSGAGQGGGSVLVACDGQFRGAFRFTSRLRADAGGLIRRLGHRYDLALLSGDNAREREQFSALFGPQAHLHFNQSPVDKLGFIARLQADGKTVMMVGDGLNDAGALKQSDVGVAVVEDVGSFSPASDVILAANQVAGLGEVLHFSSRVVKIVWLSFAISSVYNTVGLSIAASGRLSPVICAILMPLSSVTVVAFASLATRFAARASRWAPDAMKAGGQR